MSCVATGVRLSSRLPAAKCALVVARQLSFQQMQLRTRCVGTGFRWTRAPSAGIEHRNASASGSEIGIVIVEDCVLAIPGRKADLLVGRPCSGETVVVELGIDPVLEYYVAAHRVCLAKQHGAARRTA